MNADLCLGCGMCIRACTHEARHPLDDAERFFADLKRGVKMVAVVAPAVAAVWPDRWLRLNGWLHSLDISRVFDVSFGAELTVKSYLDHLQRNNPKAIIAQPCPALVTCIEIYRPELIPHLAPCDSPMLHTARMVRRYHPDLKAHRIVVCSPCAAKRREFDETGSGDYNLTFSSIVTHLKHAGQRLDDFAAVDYDNPPAERAVLFSTPGGLLETARRARKMQAHFQEADGANTPETLQKAVLASLEAHWEPGLYQRTYVDRRANVRHRRPAAHEQEGIDLRMEKRGRQDVLNCGGCGYGTCEEMAVAIHNGLNRLENCHLYRQRQVELAAARAEALLAQTDLEKHLRTIASAITEIDQGTRQEGHFPPKGRGRPIQACPAEIPPDLAQAPPFQEKQVPQGMFPLRAASVPCQSPWIW